MDKFLEKNLNTTIRDWLIYHQDNLHFNQRYRGIKMIKNPFDLVVYEEILWDVRPSVIVEIGSQQGGFAFWLNDRMRLIGQDCKIVTVDIKEDAKNNLEGINYKNFIHVVGDCNSSRTIERVSKEIRQNDKVLIIEDSSHTYENTYNALCSYNHLITPGSYFIIEDGICDLIDFGVSPGPMKAVEDWILKNDKFEIDRTKERYIMTYNPKGFLKKIN